MSIFTKERPLTFDIAKGYLGHFDFTGLTVETKDSWIEARKRSFSVLAQTYLQDKRLTGSNEHYYATVFEVALQHFIEQNVAANSGIKAKTAYELALETIDYTKSFSPNKLKKPYAQYKNTAYPESLIEHYLEQLKLQPIEYAWYNENNPDGLHLEIFFVAWSWYFDEKTN